MRTYVHTVFSEVTKTLRGRQKKNKKNLATVIIVISFIPFLEGSLARCLPSTRSPVAPPSTTPVTAAAADPASRRCPPSGTRPPGRSTAGRTSPNSRRGCRSTGQSMKTKILTSASVGTIHDHYLQMTKKLNSNVLY